jgi:hypothetical protein
MTAIAIGTPGIHGLHIMTMRWDEVVPTLVRQGLGIRARDQG